MKIIKNMKFEKLYWSEKKPQLHCLSILHIRKMPIANLSISTQTTWWFILRFSWLPELLIWLSTRAKFLQNLQILHIFDVFWKSMFWLKLTDKNASIFRIFFSRRYWEWLWVSTFSVISSFFAELVGTKMWATNFAFAVDSLCTFRFIAQQCRLFNFCVFCTKGRTQGEFWG